MTWNLRSFVATLVVLAMTGFIAAAQAQSDSMRIGIIGTGNIGSALARHRAAAGHELVISSRNPQELEPLAAELRAAIADVLGAGSG